MTARQLELEAIAVNALLFSLLVTVVVVAAISACYRFFGK
jgi:hypothetical protein